MKKMIALLLSLLLVVGTIACSSAPASTASSSSSAETTNTQQAESTSTKPAESANTQSTEATTNKAASSEEVTPDFEWLKGKTIYIELGYKVGGSLDVMLRNICPIWEKTAGCTFVIENRQGANGQVAAQYVLDQDQETMPTILAYTEMYQSNMYATHDPGFGIDDFSLINMQVVDSTTICTMKQTPYNSFEDLINAMKANPGKIVCAAISGGAGLIWVEKIKDYYGVDFKVVLYDDGASMRTAMLGLHADFMLGSCAGDLNLGDDAQPLCVVGSERSPIWPDTPTSDEVCPELGLPGSLGSCRVIATTAKWKAEHPERFAALVETYRQAFESDEYQAMIKATGEDSISAFRGPEASDELQRDVYNLYLENIDVYTG